MLLEQKGKQEQVDVCVSKFSFVTTPNNGIVVEKVKKNVH